jgi:hypothetical protein
MCLAQEFATTARFWENVFHPQRHFICARNDTGGWSECDKPLWPLMALNFFDSHYTEVGASATALPRRARA